jgi:MFS transporter, FSR family, fosmidomycin resistance protein
MSATTRQFQRGRVVAVSIGHLFHDVYSSFLSPLLPLLVEKLGITLSMAGMLDVIKSAPSLLNPFLGLLVDRIRVKYFVILTPAVTAVIMSLVGVAPSYAVVVIMIFVMGVSSTLFHIPSPVLIKRFSADRTGAGMSYYMLGGELSRTLGPLIITGAVSLWGLEGTWRLIPVGLAASVVLYFVLADINDGAHNSARPDKSKTQSAIRELTPLLAALGGYTFFMMSMKVAVTLYLPAYLVDQGKSLMSASVSLSVLQFAGAVGTLFAGSISDRIGRKTTLFIAGLASPILMWLFVVSGDALARPILAALGFFLFASGPVILALVQDANSSSPSFANGTYMTVNFITRSLMVFLVGHFIGRIGFDLTYRIAAIMAVGVLPVVLLIPERKKPKVPGETDKTTQA